MRRLVAVALIVLLAGCSAEASQQQTVNVDGATAWAPSSATDYQFIRRVEDALGKLPPAAGGRRTGIVLAERLPDKDHEWIAAVLTPDGVVTVSPQGFSYCDGSASDSSAFDTYPVMIDKGDLLDWAGDGRSVHRVCPEDMRIVRKAAVQ